MSYMPTAKELASVLQRGDDQTCLGKKKGSIRLLGMLGVFSGRERERREGSERRQGFPLPCITISSFLSSSSATA
jgi:hypothetical protein